MLKVGSFVQKVPAHTQLHVEGQNEFVVLLMDSEGQAVHMLARSKDRECKLTIRKESDIKFQITGQNFLSVDARSVKPHTEEVSDIPYEIPDDNRAQLSLEEKLKLYLAEMVSERYGEDSTMMDTFEESMDFDEEDDEPLSGFEVGEITEEALIEAPTNTVSPETGSTTEADPPPETSEETPPG